MLLHYGVILHNIPVFESTFLFSQYLTLFLQFLSLIYFSDGNGMLRHAFLRVGEGISWQHILPPPWNQCSVCLSALFFIACLPSQRRSCYIQNSVRWNLCGEFHSPCVELLYILTSVWVVHTPNTGWDRLFNCFCTKKLKNLILITFFRQGKNMVFQWFGSSRIIKSRSGEENVKSWK